MDHTLTDTATTFDQFAYRRPDLERIQPQFEAELESFRNAEDAQAQYQSLERLNALRDEFFSMYNLCYVRHTANTEDAFYETENNFFDSNLPGMEDLDTRLSRALMQSPFRKELEEKTGKQLFTLADLSLKAFRPEIMEDLQKENALSTEYTKIKAQAVIEFGDQKYNLSNIGPLEISPDRTARREASAAKWSFYAENTPRISEIFDEMVKLRQGMAAKLGYANFVALGYARMRRSDYNADMVANFRRQVREYIVPLAQGLYERQRRRLGAEKLKFYDEDFKFPTGNPKPKGTPEQIVAAASEMYHALSKETGQFFDFMQHAGLMDLVNRNGKAQGGYCTFINKYKAPFIFSNFNGTSDDIDVLTHEAGHAFQVWLSKDFEIDEYHWPTSDAAEIHSMSMEFFAWPWVHLFFGEDAEKYKFMHLGSAIKFLPYGVAVDEFQHRVYANPDMSPADRNAVWRELERIYLPHRDYDGIEFLEQGGFWQKQSHIFNSPFYYIDYTLAQICAFQFWVLDRKNHQDAWARYIALCQAGGSQSFLDLVKLAGLRSPFEDGCVESVIGEIEKYLNTVDDSMF